MVKNGDSYETFSKPLYGFLTMKKFRYDRKYKHFTTQKWCWVYTMTDELSAALKEWSVNKPVNENKG